MKKAIGIDPDSTGFVCASIRSDQEKPLIKRFSVAQENLGEFLQWVQNEGEVIVAIEGTHGQSLPIERILRKAGIVFHSFKPADTDKFRKALLGQNKNNERDAESVARIALALDAQSKLPQYRRVWFADSELQMLTRQYACISQQMTQEVNRLWKTLRQISPDLYLALWSMNSVVGVRGKVLKNDGILTLLSSHPNIGEWKNLSADQLLDAMGGGSYRGRRQLITQLRAVMHSFPSPSSHMAFMMKSQAQMLSQLREDQLQLRHILDEQTAQNAAVQVLRTHRGIATFTASSMIAEIIDIRRFAREDSLACYSGLGMKEHTTGPNLRMVHTRLFNHRLKYAFMTAARNIVRYDPESQLAQYYKGLRQRDMNYLEAIKRVARALVRVVFRELSALNNPLLIQDQAPSSEEGESDMASGLPRSDKGHLSNIPLSARPNYTSPKIAKVKRHSLKSQKASVRRRKLA